MKDRAARETQTARRRERAVTVIASASDGRHAGVREEGGSRARLWGLSVRGRRKQSSWRTLAELRTHVFCSGQSRRTANDLSANRPTK